MILNISNITKSFADKTILKDVSLGVNEHEMVALIGNNGTGKTTLLNIIMGREHADSGDIFLKKDAKIAYLPQVITFEDDRTIYEEALDVFSSLIAEEKTLRDMEDGMSSLSGDELNKYMDVYHQKMDSFVNNRGLTYKNEINATLSGLKFLGGDMDRKVSSLSGGEKTRLLLALILLQKPDIILLDEPTNHLDMDSIAFLEKELLSLNCAALIISHDRYFLNKVVKKVAWINNTSILSYSGNYDDFIVKRDAYVLAKMREYNKEQAYIKKQEEVIALLRSFNREKSIKRAESRVKQLDRRATVEKVNIETTEMSLEFKVNKESGMDVLSIDNLFFDYNGNKILEGVSLEIKKGERIALIGANGTGKSTFLKLINRELRQSSGVIEYGTNVEISYFDQNAKVLDDNDTIFESIQNSYPDMTNTEIRNMLGSFSFRDDDVFKRISTLSGGERSRVILSKLMLSKGNLLILDEPTNHLDMTSKEILEEAINNFEGTVLYVSHDRYFINKTATKVVELKGGHFTQYIGNYDYYLLKSSEQNSGAKSPDAPSLVKDEPTKNNLDYQSQKKEKAEKQKREKDIKKIEEKIEALENKKVLIEESMNKPETTSNSAKLNELCSELNDINLEIDELMNKWEELES